MSYASLKLRDAKNTVRITGPRILCDRDGHPIIPIAAVTLERGCRNEESEGCKNESRGEVHLCKE